MQKRRTHRESRADVQVTFHFRFQEEGEDTEQSFRGESRGLSGSHVGSLSGKACGPQTVLNLWQRSAESFFDELLCLAGISLGRTLQFLWHNNTNQLPSL